MAIPKIAWSARIIEAGSPERDFVRIDDLRYDYLRWDEAGASGYQRPLEEPRVRKYVAAYDPHLVREVVCNRRADGTLWVLDGQHTAEVERRVGRSVVRAVIYSGLTPEQEAAIYHQLNTDRRSPNLWNRFGARVTSGDSIAIAVTDIARSCGFRVGTADRSLGSIAAVAALESVYRTFDGARLLYSTLSLIQEFWPSDVVARDGKFIEGLARFLYTWDGTWAEPDGQKIDRVRFNAVFSRVIAKEIQRYVQRLKVEHGMTPGAGAYAIAFRDIYNGKSNNTRRLTGAPAYKAGTITRRVFPNRVR